MKTVIVKNVNLWRDKYNNDNEIYLLLIGFSREDNEYIDTRIPVKDEIEKIYSNVEINDVFLNRLKYKMRLKAALNKIEINTELENEEFYLSTEIAEKYNKIFKMLTYTDDILDIIMKLNYLNEEEKTLLLKIISVERKYKLVTPIENILEKIFLLDGKILNISMHNNKEIFTTCQILELNEDNKLNYVKREINITNGINRAYEDSKVGTFFKNVVKIPYLCKYLFTYYTSRVLKNKNVIFIYDETNENEYVLNTNLIDLL